MIDPEPSAPSAGHSHDVFDLDAAGYEEAVDRSISFTRRDASFFARRKVALLTDILQSQGQSLDQAELLDVGCGAGTTDRHLAGRVKSLHGVDVSEEMLAVARTHVSEGEFVVLRRPDAPLSIRVLRRHHRHLRAPPRPPGDQTTFLRELNRVTRPGGVIAVFEHNPANPLTRRAVRGCELDVGVELLTAGDVEPTSWSGRAPGWSAGTTSSSRRSAVGWGPGSTGSAVAAPRGPARRRGPGQLIDRARHPIPTWPLSSLSRRRRR